MPMISLSRRSRPISRHISLGLSGLGLGHPTGDLTDHQQRATVRLNGGRWELMHGQSSLSSSVCMVVAELLGRPLGLMTV